MLAGGGRGVARGVGVLDMAGRSGQAIIREASLNQAQGQGFPAAKPSATQQCPRQLILGVFFDGTGNNMYRDFKGSIGEGSETNVARLFKVYRENDEPLKVREKVYMVGLGAMSDAAGAAMAADMRTQESRDQVRLVARQEKGRTGILGDLPGLSTGLGGQARLEIAYRWAQAWCKSVPPCEAKVIDVYGFSRGAALARTFVNLVNIGLKKEFERVSVRFLGIFDSVGSFGMAGDDVDVGQNMCIKAGDMAVVRHFVSGHEMRNNFPLTAIAGENRPYPGAHSDVGGGYEKRDKNGTSNRLAFVPLVDMYWSSRRALVDMDALKIPTDAKISEMRALAKKLYPRAVLMYDAEGEFIQRPGPLGQQQKQFHGAYVHKSHVAYSPANRKDPSGKRRIFPNPRRKPVKKKPPAYEWVED